jgi:hypothetical protein
VDVAQIHPMGMTSHRAIVLDSIAMLKIEGLCAVEVLVEWVAVKVRSVKWTEEGGE